MPNRAAVLYSRRTSRSRARCAEFPSPAFGSNPSACHCIAFRHRPLAGSTAAISKLPPLPHAARVLNSSAHADSVWLFQTLVLGTPRHEDTSACGYTANVSWRAGRHALAGATWQQKGQSAGVVPPHGCAPSSRGRGELRMDEDPVWGERGCRKCTATCTWKLWIYRELSQRILVFRVTKGFQE